MGVKMIITKNHAAYPEIRFLTKSISKPYGRASAMPTVWELTKQNGYVRVRKVSSSVILLEQDI